MSTPVDEARLKKHYTTAEIEAELAAAPHLAASPTCQEMCDEIQDDMDILQNLQDFPPHSRGPIAFAARRAITALNHQMKQRHCPACPA